MCEAISEGKESGRSHLLQASPEGAIVSQRQDPLRLVLLLAAPADSAQQLHLAAVHHEAQRWLHLQCCMHSGVSFSLMTSWPSTTDVDKGHNSAGSLQEMRSNAPFALLSQGSWQPEMFNHMVCQETVEELELHLDQLVDGGLHGVPTGGDRLDQRQRPPQEPLGDLPQLC